MAGAAIRDREVTWDVLDVPVFGTLTAPESGRAHSAVVLVAGSGPTDRDWSSPLLPGTNGSGRLLAEALAGRGFLTVRYDKLASGPHVRENLPRFAGKLSMQTHMDELRGAVETALSERGVEELFVLTNSEGTVHAVNYQLQATESSRFSGLVLTGVPGRSVGEVGRSQLLNQGRSLPDTAAIMGHYDDAIKEFLAGRPMTLDPTLPEGLKVVLHALENPYNMPFARELWNYSVSEHIGSVSEPILVVIGKKDIQIDWIADGKALEGATAQNTDASFVYPENANHVLKHEELPLKEISTQYAGAHYNAPGTRLDEDAAGSILRWLDERGLDPEPA